jgi:uncharacterized protein YndB with AHSA1/START domain
MSEKTVSVSTEIAAPADKVYAMVTDLPRMGEWSTENKGGTWKGGATAAAPGVKFKGRNAVGWRKWSTDVLVLDATAPSKFAFRVTVGPLKLCDWVYEIEPTATGCKVTETWIDGRGFGMPTVGRIVSGVADRSVTNKTAMEETLAKVKAAAEAS